MDIRKSQGKPEKSLPMLYYLQQDLRLCGSPETLGEFKEHRHSKPKKKNHYGKVSDKNADIWQFQGLTTPSNSWSHSSSRFLFSNVFLFLAYFWKSLHILLQIYCYVISPFSLIDLVKLVLS